MKKHDPQIPGQAGVALQDKIDKASRGKFEKFLQSKLTNQKHPMTPTATKLFPSGAWEVSAIIDGQLIRRRYFGFTKREAIRQFKLEAK